MKTLCTGNLFCRIFLPLLLFFGSLLAIYTYQLIDKDFSLLQAKDRTSIPAKTNVPSLQFSLDIYFTLMLIAALGAWWIEWTQRKRRSMEVNIQSYAKSLEEILIGSRELTTTTDLGELYKKTVHISSDFMKFDCSTLMLLEDNKLIVKQTIGFPQSIIGNIFPLLEGKGLATWVAKEKKPATVVDFNQETRFLVPQIVIDKNITSAVSVPMLIQNQIFGVLVGHTKNKRTFSANDIAVYTSFANHATIAIRNATSLESLQESEERFRDLFENSNDMIQSISPEGNILYTNRTWRKTLGYSEEESGKLKITDIIQPEQQNHCMAKFKEIMEGSELTAMETVFISKTGKEIPVEANVNCKFENGIPVLTRGIFRDITERKIMEEKLLKASNTDELTDLLNRRGFMAMANQLLKIAQRSKQGLFLLFIDLNDMKGINDRFGHEEGDNALRNTADLLRRAFRQADVIGRLGGDEFCAVLYGSEFSDKQIILKRLNEIVATHNSAPGRKYTLDLSVGIAVFDPSAPSTLDALLSQADSLMYEDKKKKNLIRRLNSVLFKSQINLSGILCILSI